MKKLIILALAFSTLNCSAQPKQGKELNVLFIGNSLTYFHDMPQTLEKMLVETDPNIKIHQSTFPGMSLSSHLTDIIESKTENGISTRQKRGTEVTETEKRLAERKWDVIILQTGPVSVLIPESRELKIDKAIADIKNFSTNPDCQFILFNTWPSKNTYPEQYCYSSVLIDPAIQKEKCCSPVLENLKQEYELINQAYELVAQKNNLINSNNGTKFYEVLTKHPEINLYEDDSHPNKYGAFLNACIFYQILTKRKSSALVFVAEIEPEKAKLIKRIAE